MTDLSVKPKRVRGDCDPKLLYGDFKKLMQHHNIKLSAAPNGRQCQNGIVKRNWYTCVRMARSWLFANNLPSKFWYYAIKRAAEISNYFPIIHNKIVTTPFELAHGQKPDFRTLFPMFSLAFVRKPIQQGGQQTKFRSQTIKAIAVGRADNSDALIFFNPESNDIITSSDYRLDITKTTGTEKIGTKPTLPVDDKGNRLKMK